MNKLFFPERIGRLSWLLRVLVGLAVGIPLILATEPVSPLRQYAPAWLMELLGWLIVLSIVVYAIWFIHLPRARSLGLHGGFLVVIFLPPVNIILAIMFLFASDGYWTRLTQRRSQSNPHDTNVA